MSVFTKAKPVGVDVLIQAYQNYLYTQLNKVWGTGDADYDSYGRVYRNQTKNGYVPEAYTGGNDYKEVLWDDTKKVVSFFGMEEKQIYNGGLQTGIYLVFLITDLGLIKPGFSWRPDEEVRRDVEVIVHAPKLGFIFKGIDTGIDNVLKDFSGWTIKEGVKYRDEHPFHCFKVNFSLLYTISNC